MVISASLHQEVPRSDPMRAACSSLRQMQCKSTQEAQPARPRAYPASRASRSIHHSPVIASGALNYPCCVALRLRSKPRPVHSRVCALLGEPWGIWAGLTAAASLGLWSERTKVGRELSGVFVATLCGLALSNSGVIPYDAPQYAIVNSFLLPLAIPMLLFSANLTRVLRDTGRLLPVFLTGSVATVISTLVAISVLPLSSLGENGWKIAAALCARHIGGAINYVAVTVGLGAEQAAVSAGLAADNLICAAYFTTLYALARSIPREPDPAQEREGEDHVEVEPEGSGRATVLHGMTAVALSAAICHAASVASVAWGQPGMAIPIATAITVAIATAAPRLVEPLVSSAECLAAILMQIFFAAVGANGSIAQVVRNAPSLFAFAFLQVFVHLALLMGVGKLLNWERRDVLLASNANVGGPTTAAGMAAAKGWRSRLVPSILIGTLGYATATFIAIGLAPLLRRMSLGA